MCRTGKPGTLLVEMWNFLKKLKIKLPYHLAIPPLGIYPNETKSLSHRDISNSYSLQHYSQKPGNGNNLASPWQMNGIKKMWYIIKGRNSCIFKIMNGPWGHSVKWNKYRERQTLYEFTYMWALKSWPHKNRVKFWLPRVARWRNMEIW